MRSGVDGSFRTTVRQRQLHSLRPVARSYRSMGLTGSSCSTAQHSGLGDVQPAVCCRRWLDGVLVNRGSFCRKTLRSSLRQRSKIQTRLMISQIPGWPLSADVDLRSLGVFAAKCMTEVHRRAVPTTVLYTPETTVDPGRRKPEAGPGIRGRLFFDCLTGSTDEGKCRGRFGDLVTMASILPGVPALRFCHCLSAY